MSHNRKVLKTATKELGKAKAPAKPKDKLFSMPVVSTEGYKQGPPPSGSHYRIPGNGQGTSIYNPTPYPLDLVGPNGTHAQIGPWDTNTQNFNEPYMDEFPQGENDVDYEDELDEEQIAELRAGGYTVEDISVPHLSQAKKGGSLKKYSRSLEATNKLFHVSPLFKKVKSKKKKIFDPSSNYFQDGGSNTTKLTNKEEEAFQKFYPTLPDNLMQDDPEYDIRGYWDSEGRPETFDYNQPKQEDGYHHAYSINSKTGEYLKSPTHPTFQHAVDEDRKMGYRPLTNVQGRNIATENPLIADEEQRSFLTNTEGPVSFQKVGGIPNLPLREGRKAYERLGYTDNDRMAVAAEGGFLPKAQFGANVDENGKPIYYTEEEYRHMSEANQRGDVGTESNPKDIGEAQAKDKAPDWARYEKEYLSKQSKDQFIADKKRDYIKRQKNLNRLAGVTMDNFPEEVERNFGNHFDYNKNSYITRRLGQKDKFNPRRRGEWVDKLTPTEKKIVADSKYGSKLQPSLWKTSLAGLQELGNAAVKVGTLGIVHDDVFKNKISGLTKKEQEEIANSNTGALSTMDFIDLAGAGISNFGFNRGLSTGSDYKELPSWYSGELMPNVTRTHAMGMNPLNLVGLGELTAGRSLLGLGAKTLRQLGKATPKIIKSVPHVVENLADAGYFGIGTKALNKISPLNLLKGYGTKQTGINIGLGDVLGNVVKGNTIKKDIDPVWKVFEKLGRIKGENPLVAAKNINKKAGDIFSVKIDPTVAGSNIAFSNTANSRLGNTYRTIKQQFSPRYNPEKNATFNVEHLGQDATHLPLNDPGITLNRRLPFSTRHVPVDVNKLMNNKFQWSTAGRGVQNLAEKYGSSAVFSGLVGAGIAPLVKQNMGEGFIGGLTSTGPTEFLKTFNPYYTTSFVEGKEVYDDVQKEREKLKLEEENKKTGGSIEMDVDDDMIQYLLSQGYDVEDID